VSGAGNEIELKLLLDEDEAEQLAASLGAPQRVEAQHNVYFDDPTGAWGRAGFGVRLRASGGNEITLTLKGRGRSIGDFVSRGEWELALPAARWPALSTGRVPLASELERLIVSQGVALPAGLPRDLAPFGFTETTRRVFPLPGDGPALSLELDRTRYPDESVVFELELEIPDAIHEPGARTRLEVVLARAGVAYRPSTVSKLQRLMLVLDRRAEG
jgi:uncharacterized protein YjbK